MPSLLPQRLIRALHDQTAVASRALTAAAALFLGAMAMPMAACSGPAYPNCSNDDHCKAKGEYCVNTKCAQCKVDSHCPGADTDKCVICQAGACGRKPDCCASNLDCGPGKKCQAGKCQAQCTGDADCAAGMKCQGGQCMAAAGGTVEAGGGCKADGDCGPGLKCKDGKCLDAKGACGLAPIYFSFNEYTLSDSAQNGIAANIKCLKERNISQMTVEGHCDERGTDAYNMELGTKRARVVKEFVQSSAPKMKVKTMSFGKTKPVCSEDNESCWDKNRRAEFRSPEK